MYAMASANAPTPGRTTASADASMSAGSSVARDARRRQLLESRGSTDCRLPLW